MTTIEYNYVTIMSIRVHFNDIVTILNTLQAIKKSIHHINNVTKYIIISFSTLISKKEDFGTIFSAYSMISLPKYILKPTKLTLMSKFFTIGLCLCSSLICQSLLSQSIINIQPQGAFMATAFDRGIYIVNPATGTIKLITNGLLCPNYANALALDTTRGVVYYDQSDNDPSNKALYGYNYRTNTHFTIINDFTTASGSPSLAIAGFGGAGGAFYNGSYYVGAEWAKSLSPTVASYSDGFDTYFPYSNRITKVNLNNAGTTITSTSLFKDYYTDNGEVNYGYYDGASFIPGKADCDWGDFVIINDTLFERVSKSSGSIFGGYQVISRAYKLSDPATKLYNKVTSTYTELTQTGEDLLHNLYYVGQPDGSDQEFVIADKKTGTFNIAATKTMTLNGQIFIDGVIDATGPLKGEGNIGNTVWYDINEDGIKQVEEIGIYDVPVEIWEDLDNDGIINIVTDKLLGTAITDFAGHYEFKNALPGNYIVRVVTAASVNYPAQNFSATYTSNVLSSSSAIAIDAGDENVAGAVAKNTIKKSINTLSFNDQSFDFGFSGIPFFLPLQNLSFTAQLYNKSVQLQWSFTSNGDEDGYVLERSIDGIQFSPIENGNIIFANHTITKTTYDNNLPPNINHIYYRLKIVDKIGNAQLSNIIKVKMSNDNSISIYPNPTSELINISLSPLFLNKPLTIKITNSLGQVVKLISLPKANSVIQVDLKDLSSGTYQCMIMQNGNSINNTPIQVK
jgi:hypothetical protein